MTDKTKEQKRIDTFWQSYLDDEDPTEQAGGVVARVDITFGYQVFPGDGERPSFFPVASAKKGDPARTKALKAARQVGGRPTWGINQLVHNDEAYKPGDAGWEACGWKEDRNEFVAKWESNMRDFLLPKLHDAQLTLPFQGYVRLGWGDSPFHVNQMKAYLAESGKSLSDLTDAERKDNGMSNEYPPGTFKYPTVMYPIQVFRDAEEAKAFMAGQEIEEDGPPLPAGDAWEGDAAGWREEVEEIFEALEGKTIKSKVKKYVTENYGDEDDESGEEGLGATLPELTAWLKHLAE